MSPKSRRTAAGKSKTSGVPPAGTAVDQVRAFNRFYTRTIGVLDPAHLNSPYSLAEVRVLYELAHWRGTTPPRATDLIRELGLDAGYLSRILSGFEKRGFLSRKAAAGDTRQNELTLTTPGRKTFRDLDRRAALSMASLLDPLDEQRERALLDSMGTIRQLLGPPASAPVEPVLLRPHRPGDMGWVVYRHGELYAREYGWNERFEALVAEVVAHFVRHFDPARERCWIAERGGVRVGSVFLVAHPERQGVAKLRLLLVEPSARGLGLGARLVDECTRFAREADYHTITLWTNSVLTSARKIYEAKGYRLVKEEPHRLFGPDLLAQTWELEL